MNKIHVEIVVNGDLKKVWKFWNEPECIKLWAFASDDWECPYAENDLVAGGKFLTRMSAKDKSFGFDFSGMYIEVKEFEKIQYVLSTDINDAEARKCEINFSDLGDGAVKITEIFDPETENSLEMQKNGWQSILNNFKQAVETSE
ncbi:SRPBCC domain-containing protein [Patescibacteria group bacterium]|nr:SRPBCC domain-containing protein [Patescibacteria group bacterium]